MKKNFKLNGTKINSITQLDDIFEHLEDVVIQSIKKRKLSGTDANFLEILIKDELHEELRQIKAMDFREANTGLWLFGGDIFIVNCPKKRLFLSDYVRATDIFTLSTRTLSTEHFNASRKELTAVHFARYLMSMIFDQIQMLSLPFQLKYIIDHLSIEVDHIIENDD